MDIVLYALTALLYGGLAVVGWRAYRTIAAGGHGGAPAMFSSVPQLAAASPRAMASGMTSMERGLLCAALVLHGVLLHTTIFPRDAMVFGFAFALSAMFWLGAGIYWIESFFFPLDGLRLLVLPLACLASL